VRFFPSVSRKQTSLPDLDDADVRTVQPQTSQFNPKLKTRVGLTVTRSITDPGSAQGQELGTVVIKSKVGPFILVAARSLLIGRAGNSAVNTLRYVKVKTVAAMAESKRYLLASLQHLRQDFSVASRIPSAAVKTVLSTSPFRIR